MTLSGDSGTASRSRWTSKPFHGHHSSFGVLSGVERMAGGKNSW
jgi:hypothetical protein